MMVGDGWETVWQQPLNECDLYGKCGDHGVCAYNGGVSCHCLRGFEPKARQDWKSGNWLGGCVRTTPLPCTSQSNNTGDGFFPVEGVKLPDLSFWASTVESEDGCQSACANNCSCEAYAYPTGIGCLIWGRELIDIYQFSQGGNTLYLKLPDSELGTGAEKWKLYVVIATVGVAALILCFLIWWKCSAGIKNCWKKGGKGESSRSSMILRLEGKRDFSGPSENGEGQEGASSELPFYKFSQISAATSKFSDSNKLGQGGFGPVYRGILPGGEQIAVKRLSASSGQGLEEFKNEVILIAKLQHRNLVRLLGCCIEGEEKILIYEYMPNKSLDAFLFEPTKQELLDWRIRFSIIEGVARGLLYLHRDSRLRIIHRDLKASNILLDEHMNPKISDFGMARIFGGDQNQANTNRVVGTYGYMSPEYAMEGLFSVKSDVYSFGVLVLEIVMSRRNSSFNRILGYAWQFWSEDRAMDLIDQSIRDSCSIDQVLRCIHVALLCVQDHNTERPDMAAVVFMLGSETATFPVPNQPKFTMGDVPNRVVVNEYESFSASDVTITAVQGR